MQTIDVCVLLFIGLVTGLSLGIAIKKKQVSRLKDIIDAGHRSYDTLLDLYMERFYSQSLEKARTEVAKKSPGRPKGSTNKTKKDGGSTTRKYTRKSSK
jgi:hypothetical protein